MPKPFGNGCGKGKAGANRTTNDEIIWDNIYKLEVYIISSNKEWIKASILPDESNFILFKMQKNLKR